MITTIAFVLSALQAPAASLQAPVLESATTLLGRMFAKYASAKTLSCNIRMTQAAMNKTLTFDTALVYERPDKIYFLQTKAGDRSYSPHLISDGVSFIYTAPSNIIKDPRSTELKESVHPKQGALTISEMWATVTQAIVHGDDSFTLETMVGRPLELKKITGDLVSFSNKGKVQFAGKLVNDIEGRWTLGMGQEGSFSMYLTDEGDLLYHQTKMSYGVDAQWLTKHRLPANAFPDGIEVTTTWMTSTAIDQPVDEHLFKLP